MTNILPEFTALTAAGAAIITFVYISIFSIVKETQ
jgi:hypothetical protein